MGRGTKAFSAGRRVLGLSERAPLATARVDAVWLLIAYILILMLIPANLTISALGAVGTPALIIGVGALVWWVCAQMNRAYSTLSPVQPIRRAMLFFTVSVLASYVVATVRPIDGTELNAADRGLLLLASWLGLILLTSDGLSTISRIETPLRMLAAVGCIVAVIGIAQFITGASIVDVIQIPGLTPNNTLTSIYNRGGFVRAAGTSTHPIEFGVVLAMIQPIALHFAFADTHRNLLLRWSPVVTIAFAIPITISRSAIVSIVVALLFLIPSWPRHRRRISYVAIAAFVATIYVLIPGMLGNLIGLFSGIGEDSSALSRTNSYALALDFIERFPILGRGFSTFVPQYRILDNQYLGLLIEVGLVGTIAILTLFITTLVMAFTARRMTTDERTRSLAQSLLAMIATGAVSFATFDAFGFPQASGLMFLGIGFVGALSNVLRRHELSDQLATPADSVS
jgi:O-antigen ligase